MSDFFQRPLPTVPLGEKNNLSFTGENKNMNITFLCLKNDNWKIATKMVTNKSDPVATGHITSLHLYH